MRKPMKLEEWNTAPSIEPFFWIQKRGDENTVYLAQATGWQSVDIAATIIVDEHKAMWQGWFNGHNTDANESENMESAMERAECFVFTLRGINARRGINIDRLKAGGGNTP